MHQQYIPVLPGTPYGPLISPLVVDVSAETNERLHIKIYDPNNPRWEIPTRYSDNTKDKGVIQGEFGGSVHY